MSATAITYAYKPTIINPYFTELLHCKNDSKHTFLWVHLQKPKLQHFQKISPSFWQYVFWFKKVRDESNLVQDWCKILE